MTDDLRTGLLRRFPVRPPIDFQLDIGLSGSNWRVQAKVLSVPTLQFGTTSAALLALEPALPAIGCLGRSLIASTGREASACVSFV